MSHTKYKKYKVRYTCGCTSSGMIVEHHCPFHNKKIEQVLKLKDEDGNIYSLEYSPDSQD